MSRLFEYLRKLDYKTEDPLLREALSTSNGDRKSSQSLEALPVLRLPQPAGDSKPKQIRPGPDLSELAVTDVKVQPADRLVWHAESNGLPVDRYRLLRMRLRELRNTGDLKSLLITSALPREGKSTILMNLATGFARRRERVLAIDGDLHRSSLTLRLGLETAPGFSQCIERALDPFAAIRRVEPLGWCSCRPASARKAPRSFCTRTQWPA